MIEPVFVDLTSFPLCFIFTYPLRESHLVIYPLPLAYGVQTDSVDAVLNNEAAEPSADKLTPGNEVLSDVSLPMPFYPPPDTINRQQIFE